jgi:site-specific recombinase XerD
MQARATGKMLDTAAGCAGLDEPRDLLGHESIATTQIYAHTSQRRIREAARSLPDVVGLGGR